MASAIKSVNGATLLIAPARGTGAAGQTVCSIELSNPASLSAVTAALEKAQTPHKGQAAPGVAAVIPGKVKAGTTPEAIIDALKKANLLEQ